jgi:hypothetical protein
MTARKKNQRQYFPSDCCVESKAETNEMNDIDAAKSNKWARFLEMLKSLLIARLLERASHSLMKFFDSAGDVHIRHNPIWATKKNTSARNDE